jgi:uncharacterized protein
MEVRDPVHGSIHISSDIIPIIKHNFFQRLRYIKQLGFSEFVFPGATHTRFLHSIGVMHIGELAFNNLFKNQMNNSDIIRLKKTFSLGCLLHDIGHAPLSHSTETVMPALSELNIPSEFLSKDDDTSRQATHEDYTIKSIADSSFTEAFKEVEEQFGVQRKFIADLIRGETSSPAYFTVNNINYFPVLHQLISSELDCDRMDYLLRDSYFCGVSYGNYDLDWILDNLQLCEQDKTVYLGITERAVVTFDDFLLSRYHMFLMVYFHYRPVCLEQLLYKYFKTSPGEYQIPGNIEHYQEHDDHHLIKILRKSTNKYAQAIVKNNIPQKVYESYNNNQLKTLEKAEQYLRSIDADYIRGSSSGRLSKYYTNENPQKKFPILVSRLDFNKSTSYMNINEATELFNKFSESHAVNRLHCNLENLSEHERIYLKEILMS